MPVFEPIPFGSPMRGGSGRFLSGASGAFRPAIAHYGEVQTFCKENVYESFSTITGSSPGLSPGPRRRRRLSRRY